MVMKLKEVPLPLLIINDLVWLRTSLSFGFLRGSWPPARSVRVSFLQLLPSSLLGDVLIYISWRHNGLPSARSQLVKMT